jgi:hypothetical protein
VASRQQQLLQQGVALRRTVAQAGFEISFTVKVVSVVAVNIAI